MKKIFFAIAALALLLASCTKEGRGSGKLRFYQANYDMKVGHTILIDCAAKPDGATLEWTSSNPEVASVVSGFVTGLRDGVTTITAKAGKAKAEATVKVSYVEVTGFDISGSNEIGINSSLILQLSNFQPAEGNVANLRFLIPDSPVIAGNINAPDAAEIFSVFPNTSDNTVTVTSSKDAKDGYLFYLDIRDINDKQLKSYKITCADRPLQSIEISKSTYQAKVDETFTLSVSTTPASPTDDCSFLWSVSDHSVLRIDEGASARTASITPIAPGTCTVTVTEINSGKTRTCTVSVRGKKTMGASEDFYFYNDYNESSGRLTARLDGSPSRVCLPNTSVYYYIGLSDGLPMTLTDMAEIEEQYGKKWQATSVPSSGAYASIEKGGSTQYPLQASYWVVNPGTGTATFTAPNGRSKSITLTGRVKTISMCQRNGGDSDPKWTGKVSTLSAEAAAFEVNLPSYGNTLYVRFCLNSGDEPHVGLEYAPSQGHMHLDNEYSLELHKNSTLSGTGADLRDGYSYEFAIYNLQSKKTPTGTYTFNYDVWGVNWTLTVK